MYNRHLQTFIQVANSGSFMKASERLYISANAVTKQINLLEEHLGVKLFRRSTQGLAITEAGQLIYNEAKKMIRQSDVVLQKARELDNRHEFTIRIGVSLMNPANILLEQWAKASVQYPKAKVEIVPFEDTVPAFREVLENFGKKIDVIACGYDTSYWGDTYNSFHLRDLPLCVSLNKAHPLAKRDMVTFEDLRGETLIVTSRGLSGGANVILDDLAKNHPQIRVKQVDYIDYNLFNEIVSLGEMLLTAECWKDVHPLLATVPIDCTYKMPYGLIYGKQPQKEVLQFIMALGKVD